MSARTPDPAKAALIAEMLCIFERDPSRAAKTALRATLAPGHGLIVLRLALGRPLEHGVPGALWDAATLERAASLYIRSQFFNDQATHYEVLGLVAAATLQAINENYRLLMQLVHPDRADHEAYWPADATARVNLARSVLRDACARADYDERLRRDGEVNARQAALKAPVQAISRPAVRQRSPSSLASPLPEWATLGVGGFAREHPAVAVFGVVIVVAASLIAAAAWSEPSFFLEREESPALESLETAGKQTLFDAIEPPSGYAGEPARGSSVDLQVAQRPTSYSTISRTSIGNRYAEDRNKFVPRPADNDHSK